MSGGTEHRVRIGAWEYVDCIYRGESAVFAIFGLSGVTAVVDRGRVAPPGVFSFRDSAREEKGGK